MASRKLGATRFCARVERGCERMNRGLEAVALVLAITTFFLSAWRVSEEIVRDEPLGQLPFIEMSTDGPELDLQSMSD